MRVTTAGKYFVFAFSNIQQRKLFETEESSRYLHILCFLFFVGCNDILAILLM